MSTLLGVRLTQLPFPGHVEIPSLVNKAGVSCLPPSPAYKALGGLSTVLRA